ncbi:DUF3566 domain-containing protein [Brachybacterium hainanense]|uniref:DUF3566 domain-containing protein n=1 Tax=Brachybacterium hainanense TaxID=1541174 RepID=A0ABV6RDB5_9MICO
MASNDQQTQQPEAPASPDEAQADHTLPVQGKGDASKGSSRSPKVKPAEDDDAGRTVRRVRLTLASIDPFSVMKLSFLIAIAIGIATVVAIVLLWNIVNTMGIWASIDSLGRDLTGGDPLPFMEFFTFSKFVSYGTVIAAVNVVIITALGTLLAFLYNIVAALLGGLTMTFTDD